MRPLGAIASVGHSVTIAQVVREAKLAATRAWRRAGAAPLQPCWAFGFASFLSPLGVSLLRLCIARTTWFVSDSCRAGREDVLDGLSTLLSNNFLLHRIDLLLECSYELRTLVRLAGSRR